MTVLATGRPVLYIDPEDSAEAAIRRLLGFGCSEDVIRDHFKHTRCPAGDDNARLATWATANKPPLSLWTVLLRLLPPMIKRGQTRGFLKVLPGAPATIHRCWAAVVLSDHVVKSAENRGRWSRGTGRNSGDMMAFRMPCMAKDTLRPLSFVRLSVAKDRNGGVGVVGQSITEFHFSPRKQD